MAELKSFTQEEITETHGDMFLYRDLYDGRHSKLFDRAKALIEQGEIIDRIEYGDVKAQNVQTPYIVVNISKMIVDIPTLFITRSMGKLQTNYPINEIEDDEEFDTDDQHIEGTQDDTFNSELFDLQQETLDQIETNSNFSKHHGMNIKQWQIDGGIVAVPEVVNGQVKLSFKERNVYYELEDGKTYQLRYIVKHGDDKYVHVHEEVEGENELTGSHTVYHMDDNGDLQLVDDEEIIFDITKLERDHRNYVLKGRKRTLFVYLPYSPTFMNRYGRSVLMGQEGKQDEVNWTMTRTAQIFERNGKPRISVSKEVMERLMQLSEQRYGVENKFDHRDLEVTTIDEDGQSLQIHQIDISKIGDITYVKDIIKMMLMETQTSEKAIDFFSSDGTQAQSGTAKFYDLFLSIMKAEQMRDEYIEFIQQGVENCMWLLNRDNSDIIIEKPIIVQKDMMPVTSKETSTLNNQSYAAGTQSLEQTVRNNNPDKSEEWIMEEVEKIEAERTSQDSMSLLRGNMTGLNFNDNKEDEEETNPVDEELKEME
ncbi:hypothetical protein MT414_14070 [Mammaliicoccus sciuri]|uniref:hypothetical protein n=1 Tax=Mammaliicoccus sciuri TaxID=1296 RepID=UPI001FB48EDA|nr:hypothetical protein [Mammaliicoccus sciuri]MCJ1763141.1 hypothetical protein [Mammaliicoccus sciuri]WQJ50700.1 hypothetical protein P3U25_05545 [Mammaliicoccus sciuri]